MTNHSSAHVLRAAGPGEPALWRRAIAVLVAVLAVAMGLAGGPARAHAAGTPAAAVAPPLHRYSPEYMGGHQRYTLAQAVAIAQQFDVIAAQGGTFTAFVGAMKAANPSLRIAVYLNGTFDQSGQGTSYPSTWYARDSRGNRIRSVGFGNYLMNPANPSWAPTVALQCRARIAASKYDGCMVDTLGTGPLGPGYVSGYPVNPATHGGFTAAAWMAATSHIAATTQAANPGRMIIPNGLGNGNKYYDTSGGSTRPLIAATGVGMAEIWLRVSKDPVSAFPSAADWQKDVNMVADAESHGWTMLVVVKLWTNASQAQQDAWHRLALSSFLLGANSHAAISFSTAHSAGALTTTTPYDRAAIGVPSAGPVNHGGLVERSFTHGVAAVNASGGSLTVQLGGAFHNLAGQTVTSESLPPHSGDVFTH